MSLYNQRGASAQKEEVHLAVKDLDSGLYPHSFCKIYPDILCGEKNWVNVMHADGAGTKSILAYMYWKETGDISVWKGIAQDAIVMNLDDLLCAGVYDDIVFNSIIDRNKLRIPGTVLQEIINGTSHFFEMLEQFGIHVKFMGGETADVGDVVRTVTVNGVMTARWRAEQVISNEKIQMGDVIVGLASYGKSTYETEYNSGIGSNGLTSARHDVLSKKYATQFPESYEHDLDDEVVYIGRHNLTDPMPGNPALSVGKHLLSPTRTYAPIIKEVLESMFGGIHGMIHCSGGGQTKCLKYLPRPLRIVKDNLFSPPPVFELIRNSSGAEMREMYQVFNMGCRLEIYCPSEYAREIISISNKFGVEAAIIGRVEPADKKELILDNADGTFRF